MSFYSGSDPGVVCDSSSFIWGSVNVSRGDGTVEWVEEDVVFLGI